jgi:glutamate mutase epsilon subunit
MKKDPQAGLWKPTNKAIDPLTQGKVLTDAQKVVELEKYAADQKILKDEIEHHETLPPRKKYNWSLDMSLAEEWNKTFTINQSLIHLDLSHNTIDSRELIEMKKGLDQNHSILGIHLAGNEGTVDALGFMNPFDEDGKQVEDIGIHNIMTRI